MAEKPKNTQPNPKEEYQVVRLPLRTPVGGAAEPVKAETTSGKLAARKEEK